MSEFIKGLDLNYLSVEEAKTVAKYIEGIPTENKVLVATPTEVKMKKSNLIIPTDAKDTDGVPKVGVVIKSGYLTEGYETYRDHVQTGRMVHYGLYAGKEISKSMDDIPEFIDKGEQRFTVLQLNEIAFSEPNHNE